MAGYQYSWFQFEDDHHGKPKQTPSSTSSLSSSSIGEVSTDSNGSSSCISSCDTADDASSLSSSSGRALYDLSDIMAQLPIKRGLSKFYEGKSESFTSLSSVTSLEDLAKKTSNPYRSNLMKASRSCGNGLNNSYKHYTLPKAVILKKPTRGYSYSSLSSKRSVGFMDTKAPLTSPIHKDLEC